MCCNYARHNENIKEIYTVPKNPTSLAVGVSVGYHRKDVSFDTEYPIDTPSPRHDYS